MNAIRQITAVSAMGLRSIPRRLGSSTVIVLGIAGVVVVLLGFLSMAGGLSRTLASAGRRDRAIVLRRGADSEASSSMTEEQARTIESAPGIRKNGDGKPLASAEALAMVSLPTKSDGGRAAGRGRGAGDGVAADEVRRRERRGQRARHRPDRLRAAAGDQDSLRADAPAGPARAHRRARG